MKSASPELVALLSSGRFVFAEIYRFTQPDGTVYRWTNADTQIDWAGQTYLHTGPVIERGNIRHAVGVEVDSMDVSLIAEPTRRIAGLSFPHFARNGGFDGTKVRVDRVYGASWGSPLVGAINKFVGRVSDVTPSRTEVKLVVKSDLELLNVKMPRNIYQPACMHTLFDAGCGLVKASHAVAGSVSPGSTAVRLLCGLSNAAGWFDQGTISFTSGANAGVMRTIKSYSPGEILLSLALPDIPAAGDTFSAYPGCDRAQGTCSGKFSNLGNFRGTPYVPIPETAL